MSISHFFAQLSALGDEIWPYNDHMEATPTQIINYFSGFKQNLVPLFQRPYTWGERNWGTLWDDVIAFYGVDPNEIRSSHFMGAVVTMPARSVPVGVSKFMIIDGQQRLTTIALLMCAIRDELGGEDVQRRRIQNHYLTNDGFDGTDLFKLLPTQGDRAGFSALITSARPDSPDSQFKRAYNFFRRQLKGQDSEGAPLEAGQVLKVIETRLMVVMINLSDIDDPYLIFESLNFKGSPLEQADLVRNYFLMSFPVTEQQAIYESLWLPMQERLTTSLTDFMRHFLGMEGQEVRKGDVYASIKNLVAKSNAASVRVLMARMERLSILYSQIASLTPDVNEDLRRFFQRFRRLDFGTAYPLLLSLYDDMADGQFGIEELVATLRVLDSYIVRRMIVGVPSNSLSGVFIALCRTKPITETPSAWLSAALGSESKNRRWPTDAEFHDNWLNAPTYESRVCQVALERLEEAFDHHEVVSFADASVEHVLPQTLTPEWETALGEGALVTHQRWLHTIGNLTLTGYNPELSNKPYAEKRRILSASHFEINRYFSEQECWGEPQIRARAEALFESAKSIWPRPPVVPQEEPRIERTQPAGFHSDCIKAAERCLEATFAKMSKTRYETADGKIRLICAVSAEHDGSGSPYFWFGVHRHQIDFVESSDSGWLCFGCGTPDLTMLVPVGAIKPLLEQMSVSTGPDRHYWHLQIQKRGEKLIPRLLGANDGPDLSQFVVRASASAT